MKKKKIDWDFIREMAKHSDEYVLLSDDGKKIMAADKNLKKLIKKSEKAKIKGGTLHYVPPVDMALSLICR